MAYLMSVEETYQRGFDLRCEGRYPEARVELLRVLEVDPEHVRAKWQLALIKQFYDGDFEGSIADLAAIHQANPQNEDVLYDLAMSEMMLGMQEQACGHFRALLAINPNHENAQRQIIYCP